MHWFTKARQIVHPTCRSSYRASLLREFGATTLGSCCQQRAPSKRNVRNERPVTSNSWNHRPTTGRFAPQAADQEFCSRRAARNNSLDRAMGGSEEITRSLLSVDVSIGCPRGLGLGKLHRCRQRQTTLASRVASPRHFLRPRYLTPTPFGPSKRNSMPRLSRADRSFSIVRSEPGSSEFSMRISVLPAMRASSASCC
jgi:hypothetical protein